MTNPNLSENERAWVIYTRGAAVNDDLLLSVLELSPERELSQRFFAESALRLDCQDCIFVQIFRANWQLSISASPVPAGMGLCTAYSFCTPFHLQLDDGVALVSRTFRVG